MKYVKYIPILQLYLSLLSVFIDFNFNAGDTVGYSMLTCLVYWYAFKDKFVRDCVIGLFAMNFVSLFKYELGYDNYSVIYDCTIFIVAHLRLIRYVR